MEARSFVITKSILCSMALIKKRERERGELKKKQKNLLMMS